MSTYSRVKSWSSNETLTSTDLNAEFNNIITNTNSGNLNSDNVSTSAAWTWTGTHTMSTSSKLALIDNIYLTLGSATDGDYYLRYSASNTALELSTTNADGSGTNAVVVDIQDGTDDVRVRGGLSTDNNTAPTTGIKVGGNVLSDTDSTDDLGTTSVRWANVYTDAVGDSGQTLGVKATTLSFDAASTIDTSGNNALTLDAGSAVLTLDGGTLESDATTLSFDAAATIDTSGNNALSLDAGSAVLTLDGGTLESDASTFSFDAAATIDTSGNNNLTLSAGTGTLVATAGDMTLFDDNNNADVSLSLGTSATEALVVQALNGGSNKTLEELRITTKTASGTADHGKISFHIDEENIGNINDDGITLESGKVLTGNVTGNASGTAATVTSGTQAAITTCANLTTVGTVTAGTWQSSTVIASAYLDADTAHLSTTQTFTGDKTFTGTVTVGVDDTGKDVKFFGASAGAYMEWDESADQLRLMGASADATTSTGKLLLATSLTDINANDVLGKVDFQAPHEAGGTDAITIAASIQAIAQDTFSASVNATDLIFYTGHSEAATEKFRFTSQGELGIGGANYGNDGQVLTSTGSGTAPAWETPASSGISWDGSTANGVATYKDGDEATVESNLTFDGTTLALADGRTLLVGGTSAVTTSVTATSQILGTASDDTSLMIGRWSADNDHAHIYFAKSRNATVGSVGIVQDDDHLGAVHFMADDGNDFNSEAASIRARIDGTPGSNDVPGRLIFSTTASGAASPTERMRISSTGNASIGVADDGLARLRVKHDQAQQVLWPTQTDASKVTQVMQVGSARSAGTHNLLILYSSEAGSADAEFRLQGDGNAYADGSWNASGADYQEWFESLDGTEYEIGKAVVLDGDKVRIFNSATDSADNIMGVTRPQADNKNSAVVGNTAWNHWTDKYLTDDWGVYIREDVSLWTWTDEENNYGVYERDMLRRNPDWTPPEGAVESVQSVRKLNPDYVAPNPDNAEGEPEDEGYSPRADRAEWNLIGMLGQVQIKANEPTNPRWIKMANISDAVELWMIR